MIDISDEKQFETLFRSEYQRLVNFACRYVYKPEIAEELVQDAFLNIWSKNDTISIQTSIISYLFGAVRNAALTHLKHEKVQSKYAENQSASMSVSESVDILELEELKEKIADAMNRIPKKCREIFELNRFDGKKYKEIAEQFGEYLPLVIIFLMYKGKL